MAKKKQERRFGQLPIPSGHKSYRVDKLNWIGLNKRQTVNSGELSHEENMSTHEYPYMVPCEGRKEVIDSFLGEDTTNSAYFRSIGLFAFENVVVVLYGDATYKTETETAETETAETETAETETTVTGYHIYIQYVVLDDNGEIEWFEYEAGKNTFSTYKAIFGGVVSSFETKEEYEEACKKQRSVVLFNQYDNNANILDGKYLRKLIILPDKKTINFDFADYNKAEADWLTADKSRTAPDMDESINYFTNKNTIYYKKTKYKRDDGSDIYKFIYYRWSDTKTMKEDSNGNAEYVGGFVALNGTDDVNSDCLICDDLTTYDPVPYYNDGYVEAKGKALTGTDYYERINAEMPYKYKKLTGLTRASKGSSVKGLYTESGGGFTEITDDETAREGTKYYKKNSSDDYVEVTGLTYDVEGSDVEGYYTYDDDLSPSGKASSLYKKTLYCDTYYFNTYESMIYLFVENEDDTESDASSGEENVALTEESETTENEEESSTTDTSEGVSIDGKNGSFKLSSICSFPDINYAVVHQSRLFGVGDDRIYVSGFNDYANWNYDTVNESYAGNAWTTTAQANTRAGGKFTGISVFDNHVCCFKKDFMHEIYNSQNPFRLVDIGAIGTIDNRSIQEVNGRLIFVTEDGVRMYSGATPREIGTNLGIDRFTYAVAGADDRYYYLSCADDKGEKYFFVYDTQVGAWSEQSASDGVNTFLAVGIAKAEHGMYMLTDRGKLYRMDTGVYKCDIDVEYEKGEKDSSGTIVTDESKIETLKDQPIKWSFETDLSTGTASSSGYRSVDIKHIRKIQFLAEMPEGGAEFKVYILCDDEEFDPGTNKWQLAYESGNKTGMFPVRIKPRKTAHYGYRLGFKGSGYVRIHEIEVYVRQGGELYESE